MVAAVRGLWQQAPWLRRVGACLLIWTVVVAAHTLASSADQLRRGAAFSFAAVLAETALAYLPWFLFSLVLLRWFHRRRARLAEPRAFLAWMGFFSVVYLLPQIGYQVAFSMVSARVPFSEFPARFAQWPALYWLVDIGLFGLTFAVVYAFEVYQETRRIEAGRLRLEVDNAALRLAVLRGQLEPHFLFNALNAISGLVRADNRLLALSALQQLSALLRYALDASTRERVTLADELAFVRDYARLQQMRYGERLVLTIGKGFEEEDLLAGECPPLLLQPLIENAIRHDLEGHDGVTQIRLDLRQDGPDLMLAVDNSREAGVLPNPGSGLGLAQLRDRHALLFGDAAGLTTQATEGRFTVTVHWPAEWPEER